MARSRTTRFPPLLPVVLGLCLAACPAKEEPCAVGSERCECTKGGACDPGLACLSGLCVRPRPSGDGGPTDGGPTDGGPTDADVDARPPAPEWMTACETNHDCDDDHYCASPDFAAPSCTTACDTDAECRDGHRTDAASCASGLCLPSCRNGEPCPGDAVCYLETVCLVGPGSCGDATCDFFEQQRPAACPGDCPGCGNGVIELGEQCDGDELGGFACDDLGYGSGTLLCDPVSCWFDVSLCRPGVLPGGEAK